MILSNYFTPAKLLPQLQNSDNPDMLVARIEKFRLFPRKLNLGDNILNRELKHNVQLEDVLY